MLKDQHRLQRRLRELEQRAKRERDVSGELEQLETQLRNSVAERERRGANVPKPEFADDLPVNQRREEIAAAIAQHQVVVICGETGSGKTTQLPKICLDLGRGVAGLIGHTQPRRIAARTVATRIAQELKSEAGRAVGFKVRFTDHTGPDSYIKVMTDGILLAEMQADRFLNQYDTLIIDEAHERSLNIDFLLGYLRNVLPRRPDLKLIVTSATIDPQRFARHFNNAPVIEVSGRMYPVETRYRPRVETSEDGEGEDEVQAIVGAVDEAVHEGSGDILVFFSGEREIRETAEALRKHHPPHTEILPLYSRLSVAEQLRVFAPHAGRRIVLATNVAETSLTVPGIRYVIDTGVARISRYSHRTKIQRLPVEPISQASADQRKGRCGRVGPGICIRLYSEDDYNNRPRFTDPEILRTNLANVILQMKALRLGDIESFPFIDPPDARLVRDGIRLLEELHALEVGGDSELDDKRDTLSPRERVGVRGGEVFSRDPIPSPQPSPKGRGRQTEIGSLSLIGRQLARFPVDPRLGRMLIAAGQWGCLREMAIIVSGLSVQDPRERPMEKQQQADEAHRVFQDERSDFLALLKLWTFFDEQHKHLSRHKLRQLCRQRYLSYTRLLEWRDVHSQLVALCHELELRENQVEAKYYDLHQALLTGLLSNIGMRGEEREYLGARSNKFHIFPGSALFKTKAKWVMAAQLVETSKVYAHFIAAIEPEWIEQAARHLTKSSHFEPHWEKERGEAAVYESVTLYGLPIVARRKVNYGRIDPVDARTMFIRHALVLGDYETRARFFHHNRGLMEEVAELEHKSRRPDILVDEQTLFQFYDQRIPPEIHAARRFESWLREQEKTQPEFLFLTKEALMRHAADSVTATQFPETLDIDGTRLTLTYQHEPGHADDGVTLHVPQVLLKQLDAQKLEWLVPGLLREKVIELIRGLPKNLRRNFVPVPNFADALLPALTKAEGSLHATIATQLQRMTGVEIPRDAWDEARLPAHLRMNIHVIDANGSVTASARDLEQLRGQASNAPMPSVQDAESPFERDGISTWDFGTLPEMIEVVQQQVRVKRYPAVVDKKDHIALRLFDSLSEAQDEHRRGVRRLFMLQLAQQLKYLRKSLPDIKTLCTQLAAVIGCDDLREHIIEAGVDAAFVSESELPRAADEFNRMLEAGRGVLGDEVNTLCALLQRIAGEYHALQSVIRTAKHPHVLDAVRDVQEQVGLLFAAEFITRTPRRWLEHYPRYLKAARVRLEKAAHGAAREATHREQIVQLRFRYEKCLQQAQRRQDVNTGLREFRWLLEELRVSLFAQELKAIVPVSVQRLEKKLEGC